MSDPRRVLLISLSNIGDAILTTPVLEALARHWPSAAITVLVGPRAVPLFERDPRVAQVWPYDKAAPLVEHARLIWRIQRARFDRVVNLRHGLLPRTAGHRVTQHLEVARRLGVPVEGMSPRVFVGPEDERTVDQWLSPVCASIGTTGTANWRKRMSCGRCKKYCQCIPGHHRLLRRRCAAPGQPRLV